LRAGWNSLVSCSRRDDRSSAITALNFRREMEKLAFLGGVTASRRLRDKDGGDDGDGGGGDEGINLRTGVACSQVETSLGGSRAKQYKKGKSRATVDKIAGWFLPGALRN